MPNIATALKQEISRLARKEIRTEAEALERQLKRTVKGVAESTPAKSPENDSSDARLRFRATGFARHRKRLGLSAREMGLLLDASALSVYKRESSQAKPCAKHLEAIAAVRKLGKREAAKRLEVLTQR